MTDANELAAWRRWMSKGYSRTAEAWFAVSSKTSQPDQEQE